MADINKLEAELAEARRIIRTQAEELTQLSAWARGAWQWLKVHGKGDTAAYMVRNAPVSIKES
jgi:hypothetical protein